MRLQEGWIYIEIEAIRKKSWDKIVTRNPKTKYGIKLKQLILKVKRTSN